MSWWKERNNHPSKEVAQELMYVRVVERTAFVLQQFINVVNERRCRTQHVDVMAVDVLRHVDLVPELCKVRHVQRYSLIRNCRTKIDDRFRQTQLVDGHADQKIYQQVIRLIELKQRRVVCGVDTLVHAQNQLSFISSAHIDTDSYYHFQFNWPIPFKNSLN